MVNFKRIVLEAPIIFCANFFFAEKQSIWNVHFRCFPFILAPDCVGRSRIPPTGRNPTCPAPWPPLFGTQLNCLLFRVEIWPTKNYFFKIKFNSKNEPPLKSPNIQGILLTPNSAKVTLFWIFRLDSLQGVEKPTECVGPAEAHPNPSSLTFSHAQKQRFHSVGHSGSTG